MFDVSFSELLVIGIVALVVIGPERLPKVARTAGLLLGRLQRYVASVKADISREMQLEELKNLRSQMQESARELERSIAGGIQAVEQGVAETVDAVKTEIEQAAEEKPETKSEADVPALPETPTVKPDDAPPAKG